MAGVIAATGVQWPAFAVLAIPGAACMLLLFTLRRHSDDELFDSKGIAEPVATDGSSVARSAVAVEQR